MDKYPQKALYPAADGDYIPPSTQKFY